VLPHATTAAAIVTIAPSPMLLRTREQ
jgi:hypothetical protein